MNSNLIHQRWHETTSPFVFRLSDGTRMPVAHPDFMIMIPGQIIVSLDDVSGKRKNGKP